MNAMQLLLKRYKRRINKVIKGGSILSILFALIISLAIPPFNIFASTQTIIVPTYSSSSTESAWTSHIHVENYCEGTNASTNSCILKFTVDDNYYGMIAFDAYNGNTKWIDYQNVFIAGGYGEYHYNFWSSGQIVMNRVNINAVSLVLPDSNVDLTQIIQLLTSINSYNQQIEGNQDTQISQLQTVINDLIISNGYLNTISKLRQYDLFPESYGWYSYLFNNDFLVNENTKIYYYNYPVYNIEANKQIFWTTNLGTGTIQKLWLFFSTTAYITSSNIGNYFDLSSFNVEHLSLIGYYKPILIYRICLTGNYEVNQNQDYILKTLRPLPYFTPLTAGIYSSNDVNQIFPFNSELALYLGVQNKELNYLNIIANGTTQSNSSSSNLETQKGSFDTTSNSLYSSENAFNTDMNSKLQSIDTSFNPSTSFGSKFLSSADWVRTQFNNLTSTSPFGTVLSFSMLLGLSLLIIGKVFK